MDTTTLVCDICGQPNIPLANGHPHAGSALCRPNAAAVSATPPKTRTITLTDRRPVKIVETEWPVTATATDRPGSSHNGTPVPDSETDEYTLRVRQHADGRAIVYGVIDAATAWTGTQDWRGGELLEAGADLAAAIRRVGEAGGMPDAVIRECIADLPAEEI